MIRIAKLIRGTRYRIIHFIERKKLLQVPLKAKFFACVTVADKSRTHGSFDVTRVTLYSFKHSSRHRSLKFYGKLHSLFPCESLHTVQSFVVPQFLSLSCHVQFLLNFFKSQLTDGNGDGSFLPFWLVSLIKCNLSI